VQNDTILLSSGLERGIKQWLKVCLVVKKYKSELANDIATSRLQQFAADITHRRLQGLEVPPKFWKYL
jgi:hypothetical protein